MRAAAALRGIVSRFAELDALWEAVLVDYDHDQSKARVRAGDVASSVAQRQNAENSPWFRRDLAEAIKRKGVRRVMADGRAYYRGLRRRG